MTVEHGDARVQRLADGFTSLMDEYNQLLLRSQLLERNLVEAKAQVSIVYLVALSLLMIQPLALDL